MRHAATVFAKAAVELIDKGKQIAAIVMGVAADSVSFDDGRFASRDTNRTFDFLELAREAAQHSLPEALKDGIAVVTDNEMHEPVFPNGTAICEVEIDPDSGAMTITRYASIDDVGRAINPLIVHGQTHGAIAQGVGQAMSEQVYLDPDSGQPLTGSLMDYAMPHADMLPSFATGIAEVLSPTNPLGIKAGGEGGTTAAPAAVVSAVLDALRGIGVRDLAMPVTPYVIWAAIQQAKSRQDLAVVTSLTKQPRRMTVPPNNQRQAEGETNQWRTRSSSAARSPARSIRRPCRTRCRSRPIRSPPRRSTPPRPAPRSCICMRATPRTAGRRRKPRVFMQFLPRIKQATDAVVNITTGGAVTMTVDQRISAANTLSPEMCSMNMGSMNFALYPMAKRYKNWKYDWEESYLLNSDGYIFPNTFRDIEKVYKTLGEGHGVKFEHECYDTGHLYNLAHLVDRGMFKPPIFLQLIFGILGGIGRRSRQSVFHEAHRRPAVRQGLSVVGAGRRPPSDEFLHRRRDDRRQCAGRAGGLALYRAGQARQKQCRAGGQDSPHRRGSRLRDRHTNRGAGHARA